MSANTIKLLGSRTTQLGLVDVGARWGVNKRWEAVAPYSHTLCFEADPDECARLRATAPDNVQYCPVALAAKSGELDVYVALEPACSSVYQSIRTLHEDYPPCRIQTPQRVIRVPCKRLDDVLDELKWKTVDCIKLDVQGFELSVLKGAERSLESCSLVDIEVAFNPMYEGQHLFCDVDRFLRDHGFVLWKLDNLVHYAPEVVPKSQTLFHIAAEPHQPVQTMIGSGQLFWAQAQYVCADFPRTSIAPLFAPRAIRSALLMGSYNFWDLAIELIRKSGDEVLLNAVRESLTSS